RHCKIGFCRWSGEGTASEATAVTTVVVLSLPLAATCLRQVAGSFVGSIKIQSHTGCTMAVKVVVEARRSGKNRRLQGNHTWMAVAATLRAHLRSLSNLSERLRAE